MADEYYWSTFYDSDDLVGRVLWYGNDGGGHYGYVHDFDRGNMTKSETNHPMRLFILGLYLDSW